MPNNIEGVIASSHKSSWLKDVRMGEGRTERPSSQEPRRQCGTEPTGQRQTLVKWRKEGSCGTLCHLVEVIISPPAKNAQAGRAKECRPDITFAPKSRLSSRFLVVRREPFSRNENPAKPVSATVSICRKIRIIIRVDEPFGRCQAHPQGTSKERCAWPRHRSIATRKTSR
jgi:hypothetical protein